MIIYAYLIHLYQEFCKIQIVLNVVLQNYRIDEGFDIKVAINSIIGHGNINEIG